MPPSLQDWLPDNHLARFVVDIVDQLDLSSIEKAYGGGGKAAYHPSVMLSLLFYGYATGTFSSRKLEQATWDSVAVRFITADTHPDHDTIAAFRKRFLNELGALFGEVLLLCHSMGVLKLGSVSLDGTKIKANASKHKAMSWKYANQLEKRLQEEVAALLKRAEEADAIDDVELDIPAELSRRADRLAAIARAKEELQSRAKTRYDEEKRLYDEKMTQREAKEKSTGKKSRGPVPTEPVCEPHDKDQVNFTDKESRIMRSSEGFIQGFNAQAGVDVETHLIVANHLTQNANDRQEIEPALDQLDALDGSLGEVSELLADTGYHSRHNIECCERSDIVPFIAPKRDSHNQWLTDRLSPLAPCPENADSVEKMAWRLKTPEGKQLYAKRKSTVETVFGVIKHVMGFRQFSLRGLDAVGGEWNLVCMAWNMKRMHTLVKQI